MKSLKEVITVLFLLVVIIGANSCKKVETTGPQGPAGPSLTGNLKGHVYCYDQYGSTVLTDISGIKDSLNGTTKVVVTDTNGLYTFAGLTTGNYSFTITANGYGQSKVENIQFVGGGDTYHDVKLSQIPSFNVLTLTDTIIGTNVIIKGTLPTDTKIRSVILFVGNVSNVSALPQYYLDYFSKSTTATVLNSFSITIPQSDFIDLGIASGNKAYFAAYGAAAGFNTSSEYEDLATGRTVFTAISSTPATANVAVP